MEYKTLWANEIVRSPDKIKELVGIYCLLCDRTVSGGKFDNLIKAINLMSGEWECVNIASTAGVSLYALMKRKGGK
jgi:hypothetical protein